MWQTRRTPFGFPVRPSTQSAARELIEVWQPTRGVHAGLSDAATPAGFATAASNWVFENGYVAPRSGLSQSGGSSHLGDVPVGDAHAFDAEGYEHLLAFSSGTVSLLGRTSSTWTALTYSGTQGALSGTSADPVIAASSYDPSLDKRIVAFTNGVQPPKVLTLGASVTTYGDLTDFLSLGSVAQAVCAFDNRLVFLNVTNFGVSSPTRVVWSVRGQPSSYSLGGGAGFEEIMEMKGQGAVILPERDGLVLMTDREIWKGRKRYDDAAFEFYALIRGLGCPYVRTAVETPLGAVFLGHDYDVYVVQGDSVTPLGADESGSRVQQTLQGELTSPERAWGLYNSLAQRYELYYCAGTDQPQKALYFCFKNGSWWPQTFAYGLSAGEEMQAPSTTSRYVYALTSAGTSLRFDAAQDTDDGSAFTATLRSHPLRTPGTQGSLHEVHLTHESASTATVAVRASGDMGRTYGSGSTTVMSGADNTRAFAPVYATGPQPVVELRVTDGSRPRVAAVDARFRVRGRLNGAA